MEGGLNEFLPVVMMAVVIWLLGLSGGVYWIVSKLRKLGKGVSGGNLVNVLDKVLASERLNRKAIEELKHELAELRKDAALHIQRVGLVRFNPFNETGGDQSFCLSLLDEKGDGFVISCLHTRDRTRMYAKAVKKGKSKYELSREEKKAIAEALKKK